MFNPAIVLITPMLERHPEWFPKFRDIFLESDTRPEFNGFIQIASAAYDDPDYTAHIEIAKAHPNYHANYVEGDYLVLVYDVPHQFKPDLIFLMNGTPDLASNAYKETCMRIFKDTPQVVASLEATFAPPTVSEV